MRAALSTVEAVYEVGVDVDTESIYVAYDGAAGPPKQATVPMLEAIRQQGYDPWLHREHWPVNAREVARFRVLPIGTLRPPPR